MKTSNAISKAEIATMRKMRIDGLSIREISDKIGRSQQSVYHHLRNAAEYKPLDNRISDETRAKCLKLRADGLTHREIAKRLKVDKCSVGNLLLGVPRGKAVMHRIEVVLSDKYHDALVSAAQKMRGVSPEELLQGLVNDAVYENCVLANGG